MSDEMMLDIAKMSYELAMQDEISRHQFYVNTQRLVAALHAARAEAEAWKSLASTQASLQDELTARLSTTMSVAAEIKALQKEVERLRVDHLAITHCDNCGCSWLDNGLNPIGCPYCKQSADAKILVAERDALEAENERLRADAEAEALAKHQPCGCVTCTCEDEKQCQGCGARHCGNHADHPAYVKQQLAVVDGAAFDASFLRHIASVCRAAYDLCQPKPQRTPEDDREYNGGLCLSELANIADEIEQRLAASNARKATGITAAELGYALKRATPDQVIEYLEDDVNMHVALSIYFEEQLNQQPAAVNETMVEHIAALLYEETTGDPWTVAGVEHPGPDRDHYRRLARKVAALAAQHPVDDEVVFYDGVGAGRSSIKSCRDGVQWIRVRDRVYWPLSDSDAKRLQSACCGNGSFDGPASAPPSAPLDLQDLSDAMDEAVGIAANMLHALAQQPAEEDERDALEAENERLAEALRELEEREQHDEALLRQALEALERGAWDTLRGRNAAAAIRERLGGSANDH